MESPTTVLNFSEPPYGRREILRYLGVGNRDGEVENIIDECIAELAGKLVYKVCFREFSMSSEGETLVFPFAEVKSRDLAKNLAGCAETIIFAATVGMEIDRLIAKYQTLSPVKALTFQAIGAERIESLCDLFCEEIRKKKRPKKLKPRFSAGYGDLPIEFQKDIFAVLDCRKYIGITLNGSLLMSPSKSVTAIIGVGDVGCEGEKGGCAACGKKDCGFRRDR